MQFQNSNSIPDNCEKGFTRHRGPVTSVVQIPNSENILSCAYDSAIAMFNMESGQVDLLGYHQHLVNRIIVNEPGTLAASCSSDYTIFLWDIATKKILKVLKGHSDDVEDFAFIDETRGVSASRDCCLIVWDFDTCSPIRKLEGHEKDVLSVAYHDGRIYSAGDDMTLRVWDLDSGEQLITWGPFEAESDSCAIDPRRGRAILGCDDGYIRVFDTTNGEMTHEILAHSSGIKKVVVSPVSGDILSAAYDQRLSVWDAETLEAKLSLEKRLATWERSLSWSTDGKSILGGTFDGTVLIWDASNGKCKAELGYESECKGNACLNDVAASEHGLIALVSDDGLIRTTNIQSRRFSTITPVEPKGGRMLMNAVALDTTNNKLAVGAHNHQLHIFDIEKNRIEGEVVVPLGQGPINTIKASHHVDYAGSYFVGCYSGTIVHVDAGGQIRNQFSAHEGAVKSLCLHPTDTIGVSCGADGLLMSWNFDGDILQRYSGHSAIINCVDLSQDGRHLASVSRDFKINVYEIESGKLCNSFDTGNHSLKCVVFWDDDTVIAGDYWGTCIKVTLSDGKIVRKQIAENGISAMSHCMNFLVAVSYDGCVYVINPDALTVTRSIELMKQRLDV